MSLSMTLKPRVSEKSYALSESRNAYVFEVPLSSSRLAVRKAVEAQYGVAVLSVNTALIKGKPKRTVRKNGRQTAGRRSNFKKAYVTLKAGDKLPIFAAAEKTEQNPAGRRGSQEVK